MTTPRIPRTPVRWTDRLQFLATEILLEDGRPLGTVWDPWQQQDFQALQDPRYQHAFLERPRGHSKTGDAGSLVVAELVLGPPGQRIYALAADADQAALLLEDATQKFARNPQLAPLVLPKKNELLMRHGGSRLTVMASDVASSYGLRPDFVVADEIPEWRGRGLWDSIWSASGKRPRCRVIVIGTAGFDKTSIAWEIRQLAQAEDNWLFASRGQCASWIKPAWLAQQQRTLPSHVFHRLHLNQWVDGAGAFLSSAEVEAIFSDQIPMAPGPRMVGLDVGLVRDRTALSLLRVDGLEGCVCVDALLTFEPPPNGKVNLTEVEEAAALLSRTWSAPIVVDLWQAQLMSQRLQAAGHTVIEVQFTAESRRRAFGSLLDVIRRGQLRSRPHPELRRELLGLEIFDKGQGGWRVDHRSGQHDDHVVSVALALAGFWDETVSQNLTGLEQLDAYDHLIQGQHLQHMGYNPAALHPEYVEPDTIEGYTQQPYMFRTNPDGSRSYFYGGPA